MLKSTNGAISPAHGPHPLSAREHIQSVMNDAKSK